MIRLRVWANVRPMGWFGHAASDYFFEYDPQWIEQPGGYVLAPQFPLRLERFAGAAVKTFFEADLNVAHLIDDISSFIMRWLPQFVRDNRSAITVAIGCTGGQHRSVYIAEQLAQRFGTQQQVLIRHRDLAT